jgi:hypothetical protein
VTLTVSATKPDYMDDRAFQVLATIRALIEGIEQFQDMEDPPEWIGDELAVGFRSGEAILNHEAYEEFLETGTADELEPAIENVLTVGEVIGVEVTVDEDGGDPVEGLADYDSMEQP